MDIINHEHICMAGTEEATEQGTGHCPKSIGSTGSSSSEDLPKMNNIHFLFITKKEKTFPIYHFDTILDTYTT